MNLCVNKYGQLSFIHNIMDVIIAIEWFQEKKS